MHAYRNQKQPSFFLKLIGLFWLLFNPVLLRMASAQSLQKDNVSNHPIQKNSLTLQHTDPTHQKKADELSAALTKVIMNIDLNGVNEYGNTRLMDAIQFGDNDQVYELLQAGADPNLVTETVTPLMLAAQRNQVTIIYTLVDAGALLELKTNQYKQTALIFSVHSGHFEATEALIKLGADVNALDLNHCPPLLFAIQAKSYPIVQLLLANQAIITLPILGALNLIFEAVLTGNHLIVRVLLQRLAAEHQTNYPLLLAFEYAIVNEHFSVITEFLEFNRSLVNAVLANGIQPIHYAASLKTTNLLTHLIKYDADLNVQGLKNKKFTALEIAAANNAAKSFKLLLDLHARTDLLTSENTTLFESICKLGRHDLIQMLLDLNGKQAIPKHIVLDGFKAAWQAGHFIISESILSYDPNLLHEHFQAHSDEYTTLLHRAVALDENRLILFLHKIGADINSVSRPNKISAVSFAVTKMKLHSLAALLSLGANPNQLDKIHGTALHRACLANSTAAAKMLILNGANPLLKFQEKTPLDLCREQNEKNINPQLIRLLENSSYRVSNTLADLFLNIFTNVYLEIFLCFMLTKLLMRNWTRNWMRASQAAVQVTELKQEPLQTPDLHDNEFLDRLNKIIHAFYPNAVCEKTAHGLFRVVLPNTNIPIQRFMQKESESKLDCSVDYDTAHRIINNNLISPNVNSDSFNPETNHISYNLDHSQDAQGSRPTKEAIIENIKAQLYQVCVQSPAYQTIVFQIARGHVLRSASDLYNHLTSKASLSNQIVKITNDCTNHLQEVLRTWSEHELLSSKRTQKSLAELKRLLELNSSNTISKQIENLLARCRTLHGSIQSAPDNTVLDQLRGQLGELQQHAAFHEPKPAIYQDRLNALMSNLNQGIEFLRQNRIKEAKPKSQEQLRLQEKRHQRELEELQEQLRLEREHQEAERAKEQFRRQKEEAQQRKLEQERIQREKEEQRRLNKIKRDAERAEEALRQKKWAALKQQEERQQFAATTTTAPMPVLIQKRIVLIGDLMQRMEMHPILNDALRIQYKYALHAQCLRLFELTTQFKPRSRIALNFRNALMHQHRYFDIQALRELADRIAFKPNDPNNGKIKKLETIINALTVSNTQEDLSQLDTCLLALGVSGLATLLPSEEYSPDLHTYIETLVHLTCDLEELNTLTKVDLEYAPDQVMATKGILMCIGECYQKLLHLGYQHAVIADEADANLVRRFLSFAKDLRDKMAHHTDETSDDLALYTRYLKKSTQIKEAFTVAFAHSLEIVAEPPHDSAQYSA